MRLIDADALINKLSNVWGIPKDWDGDIDQICEDAFTLIDDAQTIEAVPLDGAYIKQIRWERDIALEQLADIGCELGRDMTDIKEKLDAASDKEYKLELTRHELDSLKTFIRNHNQPCRDCMIDFDCDVFLRGSCIAKNIDDILRKLNKLG